MTSEKLAETGPKPTVRFKGSHIDGNESIAADPDQAPFQDLNDIHVIQGLFL